MKKVIIIGHGISAFKNKNGKKIDTFDEVYRFINAKNYKETEKYVGKKTTHFIVKKKHKINIDNGITTNKILGIKKKIKRSRRAGIKILYANGCFNLNKSNEEESLENIPEKYVNMFSLDKLKSPFKPRSGLKLLFMLLNTNKQVTLCGFDVFGLNEEDDDDLEYGNGLQHYWDIQHKKGIYLHDPHIESKIIIQLIKEKKVVLL